MFNPITLNQITCLVGAKPEKEEVFNYPEKMQKMCMAQTCTLPEYENVSVIKLYYNYR